ncbi:hypothetical protein [Lysinibacillus fusiformis]|uniref:hypothetical protein n=1 Tax=Lysinibacillus fusiformis TaxID=28031 RepID=UPI0011A8A1CC|nr:hypothetical protein [Lysinibacillus fusiformis]
MKNGFNETVFILTATFSCNISVSAEEITIKKPTEEQLRIEQIIIQSELKAYQETLEVYKKLSTFSNIISDVPGFEDTFQQKRDYYIQQYGIIKISNDSSSSMPSVNPLTFGLNIASSTVYMTANYRIINARGLTAVTDSSITHKLDENTSISGLSINESTISFNMDATFCSSIKTPITH